MGQIWKTTTEEKSRSDGSAIGLVDAIVDWCQSLSGHKTLRKGLANIGTAFQAEAVVLSRYGADHNGQANTIIYDRRISVLAGPKLSRSFATAILGHYLWVTKPGTLWFSSMTDDVDDPALAHFQHQRHLQDMVVIPLEIGKKHADFLEIHFTDRVDGPKQAMLNLLVSSLVRTWADRSNGLFTNAILNNRSAKKTMGAAVGSAILSIENPAKLSRSEYRICLLLSKGLSVKALGDELSVTTSTVRTHLRKIYAKTDCAFLAELTYKILSARPDPSSALLRMA